jgi:glycerol-3-phosphate dehydrogenase
VAGTQTLWAELRWAARAEGVVHLEDLMLRRTRLGHLLPSGGSELLPHIRAVCQPELGWEDDRWGREEEAYLALWRDCYSLPDAAVIPDWRAMLAEARAERATLRPARRRRVIRQTELAGVLVGLALLAAVVFLRRRSR